MATALSWRKRAHVEDDHHPLDKLEKLDTKRSKYYYYYILESESSPSSDDADATESVYSVQDKTTDTVRDTTDTDTKTENEFELEIEYEVASLSGDSDQDTCSITSSEPEDIMLAAAAICDSSLDAFITDAEDSDGDSSGQELDDSSAHSLLDFWLCIQCQSQNDNPQFQYCDKCFQDRKTTLPVRPRRFKKTRKPNKTTTTTTLQSRSASPVKLDALKSCLSSLSDSGLGSSQELPKLCLDKIYVPSTSTQQSSQQETSNSNNNLNKNRKRNISESSQSEYEVPQPSKKSRTTNTATANVNQTKNEDKIAINPVNNNNNNNNVNEPKTNDDCNSNVCIACHDAPKNSIFLHGRIAHMCCCYKCAMRTWKLSKRCPICNRLVSNVVRVFTT